MTSSFAPLCSGSCLNFIPTASGLRGGLKIELRLWPLILFVHQILHQPPLGGSPHAETVKNKGSGLFFPLKKEGSQTQQCLRTLILNYNWTMRERKGRFHIFVISLLMWNVMQKYSWTQEKIMHCQHRTNSISFSVIHQQYQCFANVLCKYKFCIRHSHFNIKTYLYNVMTMFTIVPTTLFATGTSFTLAPRTLCLNPIIII